jgi:hypothetical protein
MTPEDAAQVVDILAKNKQHFVDLMMVEELGLMPVDPDDNPLKEGIQLNLSHYLSTSFPLFYCSPHSLHSHFFSFFDESVHLLIDPSMIDP